MCCVHTPLFRHPEIPPSLPNTGNNIISQIRVVPREDLRKYSFNLLDTYDAYAAHNVLEVCNIQPKMKKKNYMDVSHLFVC